MKMLFSMLAKSVSKTVTTLTALGFALGLSQIALADLEITEIMFNPNNEGVWEWIEVRNTGATEADLSGYLGFNLMDQEIVGPNPTIDPANATNTVIGAGEVAVIYDGFIQGGNTQNYVDQNFRDAWGLSASVPLISASFWPGLSNATGSPAQSIGFWPNESAYLMDLSPVEDDPENEPGVFTNRITSFANAAFSIDYSTDFPAVDGDGSIEWTGNGINNQSGANWVLNEAGTNGAVTSVEVQVPGIINSTDDIGNPGIAPAGSPSTPGLYITEILYDSGGDEPDWEWVEVYNSTGSPINLAGGVMDDGNGNAHAASNIASGSVPAGGTAVLYNGDEVSEADFLAAWGAGLNVIAVSDWTTALMALNNGDDTIGIWADFASYDGDNVAQANALVSQTYDEGDGFPTLSQGPSIYLAEFGLDPASGDSWENAVLGDFPGSFNALPVAGGGGMVVFHAGGDVGTPGVFSPVASADVDLDDDGDVDGADFLLIQQTNPALIADWQAQYPAGGLSAISAVPEPSSIALIGLAMACLPFARRK